MTNVFQRFQSARFDSHKLVYFVLYMALLAPPRSFKIKQFQMDIDGELANIPTSLITILELALRVTFVLIVAAGIESTIGNDIYETHSVDIFFVTLVAAGTVHSAAHHFLYSNTAHSSKTNRKYFFYRLTRNCCYAILPGFASMIPVLIWNFDHELPPFADGLAVQLYVWTTTAFAVIGFIEAKLMSRKPLG